MTIEDKNIVWLDLFPFLSYQKKIKLLSLFDVNLDIKKVFLLKPKFREVLTQEEFTKMSALLDDNYLNTQIQRFEKDNIQIITIYNEKYPALLKEIDSPPLCLYCKGNLQLLNTTAISVVGTRKPTDYGTVVTKQFVKELANCGVTIVSGMAVGIDTIAHKTALEENGNTIAVLAGGLNHIYPSINIGLSRKIAENNLLITETSPDISAQNYYFPLRNRIIAGISKGVLVPEAGEKSGSLITINYAIDYNREIFAVPGKINSPMSEGVNKIINDFPPSFTISPEKILDFLQIKKENLKNSSVQLDLNEQIILNYISADKHTFQEIADHTKLPANQLNAILLELEMNGIVTKLANNSYIKI